MSCSSSAHIRRPLMLLFGPLCGVVLALNLIVENLLTLSLLSILDDAGAHEGQRLSAAAVLSAAIPMLEICAAWAAAQA